MTRALSSDPWIGSELAGYRLEELIGRGGMSVVYRAEDLALGRNVALKLMSPELCEDQRFRERFRLESRLAASIDHPNVIPIYEAGEADRQLFIAMRYVEGIDLKALLKEDLLFECLTGRVPYPRATELEVLWAHLDEPPPKPSELDSALPETLDGVIAKAMAKEPGERYRSGKELIEAAEAALPEPFAHLIASALEKAARRARARGAPDAAAELSEEARRQTPRSDVDALRRHTIEAAEYHLQSGNTARSRALLEEAVRTSPPGCGRAEACSQLAWTVAYEVGYEAAGELFRTAAAEACDQCDAHSRPSAMRSAGFRSWAGRAGSAG